MISHNFTVLILAFVLIQVNLFTKNTLTKYDIDTHETFTVKNGFNGICMCTISLMKKVTVEAASFHM